MFRNIEERKLMRIYKEYADETGCAVNDVIMQQIDIYRKEDEAAEKDEDRKAAAFSLEEINVKITSSAAYPSAETVYFDELLDEDMKKLKAIIATLTPLQRERIYMHTFHQMTFKEIAELEKVSSESVRESFWQGIKRLRKYSDFIQNMPLKKWIHLFK